MPKTYLKVIYYDEGLSFGGTLMLLQMVFNAVDRNTILPRLISSLPKQQALKYFDNKDIALLSASRLNYASAIRWKNWANKHLYLSPRLASYLFSLAKFIVDIPGQLRLFFTLYREKPDVLHINNSFSPLVCAMLLNIPVIWHFHGKPSHRGPLQKLLTHKVKRYIAISEYIKQEAVIAGYPKEKITKTLNPAPDIQLADPDHKSYRSQIGVNDRAIILTHIGRLVPWKGQMAFLQAFSLALKSEPNLFALIIGDDGENITSDYKNEIQQFINRENIAANVSLLGHVDNPLYHIQHADILVHSSLEPEPFGLVITEALSVGTTVIASDIGAPKEIIEHGQNGIINNPLKNQKFSDTILDLAKNPDYRRNLSLNGKKFVIGSLNLKKYLLTIETIYLRLLTNIPE